MKKMSLFVDNQTFQEGGGLTSKLIPKQLSPLGVGLGFGVAGAAALGQQMLARHNQLEMGPTTYEGGPARMTHNITSGAIEAIVNATNDPEVRNDMIKKMMRTDDGLINNIEEYGVDGQFISAFYGMG